jgi:hypothetical protein
MTTDRRPGGPVGQLRNDNRTRATTAQQPEPAPATMKMNAGAVYGNQFGGQFPSPAARWHCFKILNEFHFEVKIFRF